MGKRSNGKLGFDAAVQQAMNRWNLTEIQRLLRERQLQKEARKLARLEHPEKVKFNYEMNGSAMAASTLKKALGDVAGEFVDKQMHSRATGVHQKMVKFGDGEVRRRAIRVEQNKEQYLQLKLDPKRKLCERMYFRTMLDVNDARNTVTVHLPAFHPESDLNGPDRAKGFRVVLVAVVMSDYSYCGGETVYAPEHPKLAGMSAMADSGYLSMFKPVAEMRIVAELPELPFLPDGTVLLACLGIQFALEVNGKLQSMASGSAMEVVGVF